MTKRFILALLLSCPPLWATTYYVGNCVTVGNDRNNGASPSTPWLTINKVNTSKFYPGDSILFESTCTWREQLTVPSSGSAGSPITFGAYGTGAAPIISGANLFTSWTLSSGSVYYTSYSTAPNQVFEDGARLTQNTVSAASLTAGQWYLDTVNSRIWVYLTAGDSPSGHTVEASQRNNAILVDAQNYVTVNGIDTEKANFHNLYVYESSNNFTVLNSSFNWAYEHGFFAYTDNSSTAANGYVGYSTASHNGGDGISLNPGVDTWTIEHNNIYNNSALYDGNVSGLLNFTGGFRAYASANLIVQFNTSWNNGVDTGASSCNTSGVGRCIGIWFDTVTGTMIARYNLIYGNQFHGLYGENLNGAQFYNNVIYGQIARTGLVAGIGLTANSTFTSENNKVYNNTLYGNANGILIMGVYGGVAGRCLNNLVRNNLALGSLQENLLAIYGGENDGTDGTGNVYTYNDFGPAASNFIEWGASTYESTYSAWETATGNCGTTGCSHSVQADPQFVSAAASQFWLASGSPAIDAGLNLGSPYNIGLMPGSTWPNSVVTGDQNAYGSGWEIGAFVYVPALAPPSNLQAVVH